ncbi:MAG TPA: cation-translocating P-type ATPase [Anaerolineaceae bacterium]|nr:cation-translocating P-type ATPase [Anaerolineaceae bacterium]HQK03350.1 cation-translocating P-type ATPase [Anaerolineaceae bacterium]
MDATNPLESTNQNGDQTWHDRSAEAAVLELATRPETGLTSEEVQERQKRYGFNELREKPLPTFWELLGRQLKDFIVLLLLAAAVISALLGDWLEAAVIMLIVVLNAALGVIQESKAEASLAALKKMAAPESQVLRGGIRLSIPARELVPGDIVFVEAGNYVPADIRLLESVNLRVEEAALTGESQPVQKNAAAVLPENAALGDRKNMLFAATLVSYGRGHGVVTATGMQTQIGKIADMLQSVEDSKTPLQEKLDKLGKTLATAALLICGLVFLLGLVRSGVFSQGFTEASMSAVLESFMIAVGLAIAAVPEGLSAVVTISLALGMREMIKRHALIRRLQAVETLGSITVICSDKTGTLTENRMTVTVVDMASHVLDFMHEAECGTIRSMQEVLQVEAPDEDQLRMLWECPTLLHTLAGGALCNDAILEPHPEKEERFVMIGDPTEGALIVAAARVGLTRKLLTEALPRVAEVPFDSERKRMTTAHRLPERREDLHEAVRELWSWGPDTDARYLAYTKGSVDGLLTIADKLFVEGEVVPLDAEWRQRIETANARMAEQGVRVLGVAFRTLAELPEELKAADVENGMIFVGMVGMIDPARPEVKDAVALCKSAGIRPIMITGDHPLTARHIAEDLGISTNGKALTGADLESLSDAELEEVVRDVSIFARVSPEHKLRIVQALQNNGEIVAMTGDGVNDAPALKKADIGVAMGITGTDVAKGTADMVLTDDNYASIVAAVEQGRVIYANIRKFVFFMLSTNLTEIMVIFVAVLLRLPMPLTVIQLLTLNLLTDGFPALALAVEKGEPGVMRRPPRPKNEPIIKKSLAVGLTIQTVCQTAVALTAFLLGLWWHPGAALPPGQNPLLVLLRFNWAGVDVQTAETMAFITLALCELFRAYTVRSERLSVFQLGLFSNRAMQPAFLLSLVILLSVALVTFLQPVFNTHYLAAREWAVVLGLAIIPAVVEEITKFFLRRTG